MFSFFQFAEEEKLRAAAVEVRRGVILNESFGKLSAVGLRSKETLVHVFASDYSEVSNQIKNIPQILKVSLKKLTKVWKLDLC